MVRKRQSSSSKETKDTKRAKMLEVDDPSAILSNDENIKNNGEENGIVNEESHAVEDNVSTTGIEEENNTHQYDTIETEERSKVEKEAQEEGNSDKNFEGGSPPSKSKKKTKLIKCTYLDCNEEFLDEEALIQHMCIHIKQKRYKCPVKDCTVVKSSMKEIKEHFITHKTAKLPCPFEGCNKSFTFHSELRKHLIRHNKQDKDMGNSEYDNFDCPFTGCGKKFKSEKLLMRHIATHRKNIQKKRKSYHVCCS